MQETCDRRNAKGPTIQTNDTKTQREPQYYPRAREITRTTRQLAQSHSRHETRSCQEERQHHRSVGSSYDEKYDGINGRGGVLHSPRIASMAAKMGLRAGWSFDITTYDRDGRAWDFNIPEMRNRAARMMPADKPVLLIVCPMCTIHNSPVSKWRIFPRPFLLIIPSATFASPQASPCSFQPKSAIIDSIPNVSAAALSAV